MERRSRTPHVQLVSTDKPERPVTLRFAANLTESDAIALLNFLSQHEWSLS